MAFLTDLRFSRRGQHRLVECIGDQLPDGMRHSPVLEHALDVQVELAS
jgi:hypothetical protein